MSKSNKLWEAGLWFIWQHNSLQNLVGLFASGYSILHVTPFEILSMSCFLLWWSCSFVSRPLFSAHFTAATLMLSEPQAWVGRRNHIQTVTPRTAGLACLRTLYGRSWEGIGSSLSPPGLHLQIHLHNFPVSLPKGSMPQPTHLYWVSNQFSILRGHHDVFNLPDIAGSIFMTGFRQHQGWELSSSQNLNPRLWRPDLGSLGLLWQCPSPTMFV